MPILYKSRDSDTLIEYMGTTAGNTPKTESENAKRFMQSKDLENIVEIELSNLKDTDFQAVCELLDWRALPSLKKLIINHCNCDINSKQKYFEGLAHLEDLELINGTVVKPQTGLAIIDSAPQLKKIRFEKKYPRFTFPADQTQLEQRIEAINSRSSPNITDTTSEAETLIWDEEGEEQQSDYENDNDAASRNSDASSYSSSSDSERMSIHFNPQSKKNNRDQISGRALDTTGSGMVNSDIDDRDSSKLSAESLRDNSSTQEEEELKVRIKPAPVFTPEQDNPVSQLNKNRSYDDDKRIDTALFNTDDFEDEGRSVNPNNESEHRYESDESVNNDKSNNNQRHAPRAFMPQHRQSDGGFNRKNLSSDSEPRRQKYGSSSMKNRHLDKRIDTASFNPDDFEDEGRSVNSNNESEHRYESDESVNNDKSNNSQRHAPRAFMPQHRQSDGGFNRKKLPSDSEPRRQRGGSSSMQNRHLYYQPPAISAPASRERSDHTSAHYKEKLSDQRIHRQPHGNPRDIDTWIGAVRSAGVRSLDQIEADIHTALQKHGRRGQDDLLRYDVTQHTDSTGDFVRLTYENKNQQQVPLLDADSDSVSVYKSWNKQGKLDLSAKALIVLGSLGIPPCPEDGINFEKGKHSPLGREVDVQFKLLQQQELQQGGDIDLIVSRNRPR